MNKILKYDFLLQFILFLISYSIIAIPKFIPILCVLFFIIQVYGLYKKEVQFKLNQISILLLVFYLCYLIGSFFTDHSSEALRYLENKFSFVIFPILFSFQSKTKLNLKSAAIGIFIGLLTVFILGLKNSFFCYKSTNEINSFFSVYFSYLHHPTYLSEYSLFTFFIFLFGYIQKWKIFNLVGLIFCFLIVIMIEILSASLSSQLFVIIVFSVILLTLMYLKLSKIGSILLLLLFPFLLYKSLSNIPLLRDQFNSSKVFMTEYYESPQKFIKKYGTTEGGNITRLIMWTVCVEEIKEHPFGVGTGNVDDYLRKRLLKYGLVELADKNYNPHNQFLQTFLEIGFLGFGVFLSFIISVFRYGYKNRNWLLLLIISSLMFNSLFESMLQRQSGIVFYSFWICLLILFSENSRKTNSTSNLA